MKKQLFYFALLLCVSCSQKQHQSGKSLNAIAEDYVRLGLSIGDYDTDFVDAYYGPDSLKPTGVKNARFPKDSFLLAVRTMENELQTFSGKDSSAERITWMQAQLKAFERRIKIFSGEFGNFDEESRDFFAAVAPKYTEQHFKDLLVKLDSLLPGTGNISDRFQQLARKFIIPKNKIDTVFKTAIAEARKRSLPHYHIPENENFSMEYVTGKPWSGYNWYKGNYQSLIQINTDLDIYIDRAIDLACHEGYPGHHVYNALLEKNLYRDKGHIEVSLYPLFSPQSLIAEGSANFGIDLAFPGNESIEFTKNVLLPIAGLDTSGIARYFAALKAKAALNYARNEVGRGTVDGTMNEAEALRWLKEYCLFSEAGAVKSMSFIKKYRSYIINYNYGMDLVKNYVDIKAGGAKNNDQRWEKFGVLLSNQLTAENLQ
ncbi:MAG: hypothetical protein JWQ27_973 [Ferruginibacter sp.]|nr:hypothetical protein [Ferruginibacter sp.]